MRTRLVALSLAAVMALPLAAGAASLKLHDGGTLLITSAPPSIGARSLSSAAERPPLTYLAVRPDGSTWSGVVPGSEGAPASEVALGQNPVTREVVLVFARPGAGGHDLAAVGWTGQGWTDAQVLTSDRADNHVPVLSYRPTGEALLAWVKEGTKRSLLLRHFDLAPGFEPRTFTYVDLGDPAAIFPDATARLGADPHVLQIVAGVESLSAYLLLAGPDGSPAGVMRVELDSGVDPGGFGAAPVPVNFIRPTTQSAENAGSLSGRSSGAVTGQALEPWRLVFGSDSAWYWSEGVRAQIVAIRGGEAGLPVGFDVPQQEILLHAAAYRLARTELGLGLRRALVDAVPRRLR